MTKEPTEKPDAVPPRPTDAPRKLAGRGKWCALRDNVTRLYFLAAALAILGAAGWMAAQYREWLADDHLVQTGRRVQVNVYAVDTYRGESKRSRDQSGARYAHFVFPVPGEERIQGVAMLKTGQIPAEGVGGVIRLLQLCPPNDMELYVVESQFRLLRDDPVATRAAEAGLKIDMRRIHHGRAHPILKRATAEYTFELKSASVPNLSVRGTAALPKTVRFRGEYALSKSEEAIEKSGRRTQTARIRYLRENPHVQMAESVLGRLITAAASGEAKVVDAVVVKIEPVRGLRPLLELDDWRAVTFEFPTGRTYVADDPEVKADAGLLGRPKRFEYGNVRLSGLEASDPLEGDGLDVYFDPRDPTRFVLHQVRKVSSRAGEQAEGHTVLIHGPQKLTTSLVFPSLLLLVGVAAAAAGVVRLMAVMRIARLGKGALATIVSVATSSVGLNSRRNFFRYQFGKRRQRQGSHTASVKHTGPLAEGDRVWVLLAPGAGRTAMIARAILPDDQFVDGQPLEAADAKPMAIEKESTDS